MIDNASIPQYSRALAPSIVGRLDAVETRLQVAPCRVDAQTVFPEPNGRKLPKILGDLLQAGVELVAVCAVGAWIGLAFDKLVDTSPWGLIGFFLLGAAGGIRALLRLSMAIHAAPGASPLPEDNPVSHTESTESPPAPAT